MTAKDNGRAQGTALGDRCRTYSVDDRMQVEDLGTMYGYPKAPS